MSAMTETNSSNPSSTQKPKKKISCLLLVLGGAALSVVGIFLILVILVLLDDDKTKPIPTATTTSTPVPTATPVTLNTSETEPRPTASDLDMVTAVKIAYPEGSYAATAPLGSSDMNLDFEGGTRWRNDSIYRDFPSDANDGTLVEYITTANDIVRFTENGKNKALVILISGPEQDLMSSPHLGVAVLSLQNNVWTLESRNEFGLITPEEEGMPFVKLFHVGPNRFGFVVDLYGIRQGLMVHKQRLIAQNSNGYFVALNDFYISGSNEGVGLDANQTYSFTSTLEWQSHESSSTYYPIKMTTTGTCPSANGGVNPVNISTRYELSEDEVLEYSSVETDIYKVCQIED